MTFYTYDQVLQASKEYFQGDDFAAKVFVDKYALQTNQGQFLELTPQDMHRRLAKELARVEAKYPNPLSEDEIFNLLDRFKYIVPQGSPMSSIGNPYQLQSLGNCFVVDSPLDSFGGILKTDQELAQLMKRRCGVGVDISNIRPKDTVTQNAAKTSDGIGVFMERFSNTTREVAQNGRRGALLESIDIRHPDIETFVTIKKDKTKVTGANISIKLNDEFMQAVKDDTDFTLQWPVESKTPSVTKVIKAKDLWDKIIDSAWACVAPETEVTVRNEQGQIQSVTMGRLVDELFDDTQSYYINSIGLNDLSLEWKKITAVQKYKNTKKTFKFKTETGAEVVLTEDHLVYKLNDQGHIQYLPAGKLQLNDKIILSKKLLPGHQAQTKINLLNHLDHFDIGDQLSGKDIDDLLQLEEAKVILGKFANDENKSSYYLRQKYITVTDFKKISHLKSTYSQVYFSPARHSKIFPSQLTITPNLAKFFGLWLAEGDFNSGSCIRLHINTNEQSAYQVMLDEVCDYFACQYQTTSDGNYTVITLNSAFLVKLIKLLGFRTQAFEDKNLPDQVFNWHPTLQKALLTGLFAGDGTVTSGCPELSQSNLALLQKVKLLLLTFGIHTSLRSSSPAGTKMIKDKLCQVKESFKLSVYHEFNQTFLDQIGLVHTHKNDKVNLKGGSPLFGVPHELDWSVFKNKSSDLHANSKVNYVLQHQLNKTSSKIEEYLSSDIYFTRVVELNQVSVDYVYDLTVEDHHTFVLNNGLLLSNSAEPGLLYWSTLIKNSIPDLYAEQHPEFKTQSTNPCGELPLGLDSCRLLTLNLQSFVQNPFTSEAYFDFENFKHKAIIGQRLMDDIIDLELEAMDKIINKIISDPEPEVIKQVELNLWQVYRQSCANGRRTGLGITALGDALAMMNIKYGSPESIKVTDKIYRTLGVGAHVSSCLMAQERGAFPIFSYDLEKDHEYLNFMMEACGEETKTLWRSTGRRNIATTTTAPTGSVSTLTQTSSGIEPVFLLSYTRRKKINPSDKNARVDFIDDVGDKWQEFTVYHHGVKTWMDITQETDISKSPYWKATSNDVDWVASVDLQAAAQKYIDHSISKTCVTKDALIETSQGLLYMDEIVNFNHADKNYSQKCDEDLMVKNYKNIFVKPSYFHLMGEKPTLQVVLSNGLELKVSAREQFLVLEEDTGLDVWKHIEDINVGDRVKIK